MKVRSLFAVSLLLGIMLLSFVSAQNTEAGRFLQTASDQVSDILNVLIQPLLGADFASPSDTFAAFLLAMIIFIFVWSAVDAFPGLSNKKWAVSLIALAVTILASRAMMDQRILDTILLPYGVMGVAMTAVLPFALYFYWVEIGLQGTNSIVRRVAWFVYFGVFIGLSVTRYDEIGGLTWIYAGTAFASLVMMSVDKTFQKIWYKARNENLQEIGDIKTKNALTGEWQDLSKKFASGSITGQDFTRLKADLNRRARRFGLKFG